MKQVIAKSSSMRSNGSQAKPAYCRVCSAAGIWDIYRMNPSPLDRQGACFFSSITSRSQIICAVAVEKTCKDGETSEPE